MEATEPVEVVSGAGSRVLVDVRSKGLVSALDHAITFTGSPAPFIIRGVSGVGRTTAAGESGALDVEVMVRVPVSSFEPPADVSRFDRDKMTDNLRGKDVLDMARVPSLVFRGRYTGTLAGGTLAGDLEVRGEARSVALDVNVSRTGHGLRAEGAWQGTLRDLGIKPFKALFGALKLEDWVRIRVAVDLAGS
jgi:hypothetical protein